MRSVTGRLANPEMTNAELGAIALRVADCRSLAALPQAIFSRADALFGVAAMGLYLFDRIERLQLIASRLASPGFLDQCEREFPTNSMLDCIVTERRTIDGFHFYGAARWRRSSTYDLLHGWGYYHNMGGALVVGGRVVGAVFVGTAENDDPYDAVHVKRLDLLCRAGSVALTAVSERERLRSELSDTAAEDWRDLLSTGDDRPARSAAGGAVEIELRSTRQLVSGGPLIGCRRARARWRCSCARGNRTRSSPVNSAFRPTPSRNTFTIFVGVLARSTAPIWCTGCWSRRTTTEPTRSALVGACSFATAVGVAPHPAAPVPFMTDLPRSSGHAEHRPLGIRSDEAQ
jgi:hypothetical protein